jgi:CheY-like chemotaxis protein
MTHDKQIFIAEDNTDMQDIYRLIFAGVTDNIHLVKNGIEAIDYLSTNTPNLMILDINMPGMSGLEVLRRIKQEVRFSDVKTIIVTSNAPAASSEIASLADLFVTKPVDVFHLKILAERLLS